jgi:DNA repair exonuclease SbcCD ATPase subunit
MIRFKSLSIQNFLSYGQNPTVIDLDPGGTTLIVGEDLDNTASGTGANGVGKTVWLNALVFALYGKPVSNISLDNLVNNINQKHLEVIVEFQKNDMLYVVKRVRKEKGLGNYAKVYERPVGVELDMTVNTEQDVTPDSVKHINDFIADILGIPHELFVRIVAFSATHTPFLDLPVRHASQANQSDIMEELFRLNRLSEKAERLKAAMKDTKSSLEIKKTHNEQLEKEHERHNTLLGAAEERVKVWDFEQKEEIDEVKQELKEYEKYDIEGQLKLLESLGEHNEIVTSISKLIDDINSEIKVKEAELHSAENEMKVLEEQESGIQGKIDAWDKQHAENILAHEEAKKNLVSEEVLAEQQKLHDKFDELSAQLSKLEDGAKEVINEMTSTKKKVDKGNEELVHLQDAKCPYCLQKYESAEDKIAECENNITKLNGTIELLSEGLDSFEADILKVKEELNDVSSAKTFTQEDIAMETKLRIDLFEKIDELNAMTNPHSAGDVDGLDGRIKELNSKIKVIEKDISDLVSDRDNSQRNKDLEEAELAKIMKQIEFDSIDALYKVKGEIERLSGKLKDLADAVNPHLASFEELKAIELEPIDMDTVNKLDKKLTHQNYLLKLLTKKDSFIRKNLLNKNLTFLNQRLRGYLSDLGLPHRVEFTQEMTAHISQFGRQLDFGNLSSGQKARVNLALSFSFRDVLQRSLDSVNVCMLDEVLDVGLDSVGVQNAAHMLKRKSRDDKLTLFIISHRDEVSGIFDKTLTVQMEKGFSRVKQEI